MIALIKAWITSKLRLIEWATFGLILVLTFYAGFHTKTILVEAAQEKTKDKQIEKAQKGETQIIKQTQIIYKKVHDAKDACVTVVMPLDVTTELRKLPE